MRPPSRLQVIVLLVLPVMVAGCYTFAEPSFDPGDSRAVLSAIVRRGIVATDPLPGKTACDVPSVIGNSVYLTARLPDEDEPRDVYVHTYRARDWEDSREEVDACQAQYAAANPGAEIVRLDVPTYRVFGAGWSDALTEELTAAFEEASQAR